MRLTRSSTFAMTLALLIPAFISYAQDADRSVTGGGISVPGWVGKIDARAERAGQTINNANLFPEGKALHRDDGPSRDLLEPRQRSNR